MTKKWCQERVISSSWIFTLIFCLIINSVCFSLTDTKFPWNHWFSGWCYSKNEGWINWLVTSESNAYLFSFDISYQQPIWMQPGHCILHILIEAILCIRTFLENQHFWLFQANLMRKPMLLLFLMCTHYLLSFTFFF